MKLAWPRLVHALRALAVLLVAGGLLATSVTHRRGVDWSGGGRHTLERASIEVLQAVPGPLEVSVYLPPRHAGRERARELVARYQRHRADLALRFVAPADAPTTMREENLREGEMAIAAGERREFVKVYSEREFTNALARLARAETQWLAFVTGHGERSPARGANFDLSAFAEVLAKRGLKSQELNLAAQGAIPDNTSLLVIASPQLDYLDGEIAQIEDWLARGGALLWLLEPELPPRLAALAKRLGVTARAATVVDPATARLGIDNAAVAVVNSYTKAAPVAGFDANVLLPYATPLETRPVAGWRAEALFATGEDAWGETGPLDGGVEREAGDLAGPLTLAVALTRGRQRALFVGDGDFLSNTYLANAGNRDLGVRLVEWLSANDALVDIPSRPAPDTTLELEKPHIAAIGLAFLVLLPGASALNGLLLWWRRRRA
jgi:hypothetical protein